MDAWAEIPEITDTNSLYYAAADDPRYSSSRHCPGTTPFGFSVGSALLVVTVTVDPSAPRTNPQVALSL